MTKTDPDPVEQATAALDQAQRAADQAHATLETFKDKILAGASDISSEDYAQAAHDVEHAELKLTAAALALQGAQEAARLRRLEGIKAEILAQTSTPEDALQDWRDLAELCGRIAARCHGRRSIAQWTGQLRREGVPQVTRSDPPDQGHAGLGWIEAGMGVGDGVSIDGRAIHAVDPGMLIASAAIAGARAHGIKYLRFNENAAITNDPERWFTTRY